MQYVQNDTSVILFQADSVYSDSLAMSAFDSISVQTKTYESLFVTEISKDEFVEKPLSNREQASWVAPILVFGFILLAWGRLFFRRRLEMIFRGIFAKNYANQLIREGNLFNERIGLILFLVYLAMMSMFVYQALPLYNISIDLPPSLVYASILGFFLGLWFLKVFMIKTLSLLFNTDDNSRNILSNMYLYNLFAGIVLLPIVTCMAFANLEIFFYIGLTIIAFIYILRIIRESIIGITLIKFSVFHLILYLCTLEILPMVVLAKILVLNMIL